MSRSRTDAGIGSSEDVHDGRIANSGRRVSECAQPLDRARERELRGTEAFDEIAASNPTRFLERPEHRIHPGEPAVVALGHDCLAHDHAVPLEQSEGGRVEPLSRGGAG